MPNASVKREKRRASKARPALVSVVVPAFNEEPNLAFIYRHVRDVFARLDESLELVFVDDGSTDGSHRVLKQLHEDDPRVKVLFLSRNFGQSAALTAGIQVATGDAIVVMDADGQDPPEVVPALIEKWKAGYHVVGGRRVRRRGEPLLKRALAFLWYRLMRLLVGWELPMDTGEFRIIDRAVAEVFRACPQRHRLVRTLTSWPGFRQTTIDYEHAPRHAGRSKYTLCGSLRLAITSITGFSLMPLRIALAVGALIVAGALVALGWILFSIGPNATALSLAGLWLLGGVQCVLIGILGEYVGRTYIETQHRPLYIVRESLGFKQ